MGISLQGIGGLASGGVEGFERGNDLRIKRSEEARKVTEENERRAKYEAEQAFNEAIGGMGQLFDPNVPTEPVAPIPTAPQGGALPAGGGAPAPQGIPAAMGPPEAVPTQPPAPRKTRRQAMAEKQAQIRALAARAGGFELVDLVDKKFSSNLQQTMANYGLKAVKALAGNAQTAATLANTALEFSPVDTGFEFVAEDGKLYFEADGVRDPEPVTQERLMGMLERDLYNDEAFRDLMDEGRRAGEKGRELDQGDSQLAINRTNAESLAKNANTNAGKLALEQEFAERGMQVDEATALAAMINAKANSERATMQALKGIDNGWSTGNIITLMKDADNWVVEDMDFLDKETFVHMKEHPSDFNRFKSDVQNVMFANAPGVTRDEAARVSQILRAPGGYDYTKNDPDFRVARGKQTGALYAVVGGKRIVLDDALAGVVMSNEKFASQLENTESKNKPDPQATSWVKDDPAGIIGDVKAQQMQAQQTRDSREGMTHALPYG